MQPCPLRRAMLQRDLWAPFDFLISRNMAREGDKATRQRRDNICRKLASVLRSLTLSQTEIASLPVKLTPREWLYQPFTSDARAGEAVTCGAVASYLRPNWLEELPLPARSPQDPLTVAVALSGPA